MTYHRDINHHRTPLSYSECRNRATSVMQGRGLPSPNRDKPDITAVIGSFSHSETSGKPTGSDFKHSFQVMNKQSVHGKPMENTPEVSDGGLGVSEGDAKINFRR